MNYRITVEYTLTQNRVSILGTNEFRDLLISAQCWSKGGFHAGAYKAAQWILKEIRHKLDIEYPVFIEGHSMGSAIGEVLAYLLDKDGFSVMFTGRGGFPVTRKSIKLRGYVRIYGNDPVPALFPWFKHLVIRAYEGPKRWFPCILKDHVRY